MMMRHSTAAGHLSRGATMVRVTRMNSTCIRSFHRSLSISPLPLAVARSHGTALNHLSHATSSGSRSFASSSSSSRTLSPREKTILRLLGSISNPSKSGEDIVFSGHVRSVSEKDGNVSIILPLDEHYRELKKVITEKLRLPASVNDAAPPSGTDWLRSVRVVMESAQTLSDKSTAASSTTGTSGKAKDGLSGVKHIIAVSSCKGGVGKSTVAVNLAYALSRLSITDANSKVARDVRVGILDADVYGPSLPSMVSPRDTALRLNEHNRITPLTYEGVKLMSYGFSTPKQKEPAVTASINEASEREKNVAATGAFVRGPLASAAVRQMASSTEWGDLDYLIVDMPPGTGDIAITLTQMLAFRGAIVVTTPHKLAIVDVEKGLQMFEKVRVPLLAVVENMSYFVCGNCDTKHRIFGEHGQLILNQLLKQYGVDESQQWVELPMVTAVSESVDRADPFILQRTTDANTGKANLDSAKHAREAYQQLAQTVQRQVMEATSSNRNIPTLSFDKNTGMIRLNEAAPNAVADVSSAPAPSITPSAPLEVSAHSLRLACRCAGCVDELTGRSKLDASKVPLHVFPKGMQARGNYAVAIHWSDNHASSIYTFAHIRQLIQQQQKK